MEVKLLNIQTVSSGLVTGELVLSGRPMSWDPRAESRARCLG